MGHTCGIPSIPKAEAEGSVPVVDQSVPYSKFQTGCCMRYCLNNKQIQKQQWRKTKQDRLSPEFSSWLLEHECSDTGRADPAVPFPHGLGVWRFVYTYMEDTGQQLSSFIPFWENGKMRWTKVSCSNQFYSESQTTYSLRIKCTITRTSRHGTTCFSVEADNQITTVGVTNHLK